MIFCFSQLSRSKRIKNPLGFWKASLGTSSAESKDTENERNITLGKEIIYLELVTTYTLDKEVTKSSWECS